MNDTQKLEAEQAKQDDWVDEPAPKAKPKTKGKLKKNGKNKTVQKAKAAKKVKRVLKVGNKSKKSKKLAKKKLDPKQKITQNYKVIPAEALEFKRKANRLTRGNVTQLVRLSIRAWKPTQKELQGIRKTTRA